MILFFFGGIWIGAVLIDPALEGMNDCPRKSTSTTLLLGDLLSEIDGAGHGHGQVSTCRRQPSIARLLALIEGDVLVDNMKSVDLPKGKVMLLLGTAHEAAGSEQSVARETCTITIDLKDLAL